MDSTAGQPSDSLSGLQLNLLRKAVDIYLGIAYLDSEVPAVVRRRTEWPANVSPAELITKPPFERAGRAPGGESMIYALRLGNKRYPHMKLQVQPWPNREGFMLSVNTHDQVAGLDVGAADADAFRELQEANQRYKEQIERAWEEQGLPTFLNYLRDYIENRGIELGPGDPGVLEPQTPT